MIDMTDKFRRYMELHRTIQDKMWDIWMTSVSNMSLSHEQMLEYYREYLERLQQVGAEQTRMNEELSRQLKMNQAQLREMFEQALKTATVTGQVPGLSSFADFAAKVKDLWKLPGV